MRKRKAKARDKRDRRSRRRDELPPHVAGSVLSSEKRGGASRRKED